MNFLDLPMVRSYVDSFADCPTVFSIVAWLRPLLNYLPVASFERMVPILHNDYVTIWLLYCFLNNQCLRFDVPCATKRRLLFNSLWLRLILSKYDRSVDSRRFRSRYCSTISVSVWVMLMNQMRMGLRNSRMNRTLTDWLPMNNGCYCNSTSEWASNGGKGNQHQWCSHIGSNEATMFEFNKCHVALHKLNHWRIVVDQFFEWIFAVCMIAIVPKMSIQPRKNAIMFRDHVNSPIGIGIFFGSTFAFGTVTRFRETCWSSVDNNWTTIKIMITQYNALQLKH